MNPARATPDHIPRIECCPHKWTSIFTTRPGIQRNNDTARAKGTSRNWPSGTEKSPSGTEKWPFGTEKWPFGNEIWPRVSNRSLAGPITNTGDVSSGVQAGQKVALLVEAICGKKGRVQFRWMTKRTAEG